MGKRGKLQGTTQEHPIQGELSNTPSHFMLGKQTLVKMVSVGLLGQGSKKAFRALPLLVLLHVHGSHKQKLLVTAKNLYSCWGWSNFSSYTVD